MASLNQDVVKRIILKLPSKSIQDVIVDTLKQYDDLIENNKRRIELLEESARQLYKEWFVRFRFPGHEHVKIIDGVPEGWALGVVSDLGEVITGKTPFTKTEENFDGDIPFIKTPDMHGNTIVIKTEQCLTERGANTQSNKLLPKHSIMVSCIGTIGVTSINAFPAHTNQQINSVVPKRDELRYDYETAMRQAVNEALLKKQKLGQYAVRYSGNKVQRIEAPDIVLIEENTAKQQG